MVITNNPTNLLAQIKVGSLSQLNHKQSRFTY